MDRNLQRRAELVATATTTGEFCRHVFAPMLCGAAIYLCFRTMRIGLFDWFGRAHLLDAAVTLRSLTQPLAQDLPPWLLFSLPDGLWTYAATATVVLSGDAARGRQRSWRAAAWIGAAAAAGGELLQQWGLIAGTADPMDVVLGASGAALALWALRPTALSAPGPAGARSSLR